MSSAAQDITAWLRGYNLNY